MGHHHWHRNLRDKLRAVRGRTRLRLACVGTWRGMVLADWELQVIRKHQAQAIWFLRDRAQLKAERRTLMMLRQDAIDRGMIDLSIVYGESAIRLGFEVLR